MLILVAHLYVIYINTMDQNVDVEFLATYIHFEVQKGFVCINNGRHLIIIDGTIYTINPFME